jgi:heat shock protein HslJ
MKVLRIIAISFLFFSGCRAFNESTDQPELTDAQWQLLAMNQKAADLGNKAFIRFSDKDRKIAGKAACNSIFADYELTGNKLSFSGIGSTKMYCEGLMDQENQIITNLEKTKRYEIKYGLLYLYGSDDLLLTFKKVNTNK